MKGMCPFAKGKLVVGVVSAVWCLQAAGVEINRVTRGGPDVSLPKNSADDPEMCYGIGYPVQVGSRKAALFCNLRVIGLKCSDYENGADAFVFDELKDVGKNGPMLITRNEKEKDDVTGEQRFIVKYPPCVGFWPLGAKRSDGSTHPGEGKGFAMCQALSMVGDGKELTWDMYSKPSLKHYVEVMMLAFDGQRVSVAQRELIRTGEKWATSDGWGIRSTGLQPAIPDGDDLLMAVSAVKKGGGGGTGVCRFRFLEGQWRPVSFTLVAGGSEPSLARRKDGSFIFTARPGKKNSMDIELWAAKDAGGPWKQHLRIANVRSESPVSVHATPDGQIFVLANQPGVTSLDGKVSWFNVMRAQLALWQLAEGVAEFRPRRPRLIRDCVEEFGILETQHRWTVDHAISATVQLGDGRWHGLVAYRMMAFPSNTLKYRELVTPQTGCCVEEVGSAQPATPPWRF